MATAGVQTLTLITAPVGLQPGGYVARAYTGRDLEPPLTPRLELEVARPPGSWRIRLRWPCPEPVRDVAGDTALFPDAVALFSPRHADSPWVTMGAPGMGVDGLLWRADRDTLHRVHAEGLGTMQREAAPARWRFAAYHQEGHWQVELSLPGWETLETSGRLAAAVWRGAARERAGLKSVTQGFVEVAR